MRVAASCDFKWLVFFAELDQKEHKGEKVHNIYAGCPEVRERVLSFVTQV